MKPLARLAVVGALVAGGVALAAGLYLRKTHEAVQRVIKPVELSAPDLFPAKTLLYVEMAGWDRSAARAEEWWKRFEQTAAFHLLDRGWKKNKLNLAPDFLESIEKIEKQLARVEERFGHRPTSRLFFETYGKHLAIGALPAEKGHRPRLLLATRLPEDAPKALQGYLSKAGGVKACDPPLHQGFPVFEEADAAGSGETAYYGVGRGYLFVSDGLPELKAALDRLALATDGKDPKRPEGTLAGDPVLARVRPPAGKNESGVIYLRRDTMLADWRPELAPADEFVRNAFILAPKDEAVAFSMPDGPDGEVRASFIDGAPKPWLRSLPAGLAWMQATIPSPRAEVRKLREAEANALFDKPLWKEIDAFLSDPKKVKEFLEEALPADDRPDDEVVRRVQNDARFLGEGMKAWIRSALDVAEPAAAAALKVYPDKSAQFAVGVDLDPMSVFALAGGLDFARSRWAEWVDRAERPGVLTWSLNMATAMKAVREHAPPELAEFLDQALAGIGPSVLISANRVVLVFGPDLAKEIAALHSGGKGSFEEDPLYLEARGQVKPGFNSVSWDRPWQRIDASYGQILGWVEKLLEKADPDEDRLDFIHAGIKMVRAATEWSKPTRAVLSTGYLDPARPVESVELVDAELEKRAPSLVPPDAAAKSIELLPSDVWLYRMQRLELKPSYDALKATFLENLPGGTERLKKMLPQDEGELAAALDALIEGLVRNVKGEVGFAILTPRVKKAHDPEPGLQAIIARWPAVMAFAQFEKPVEAFKAARTFLEMIHAGINPRPWRERMAEKQEWEMPPFGSELTVGMLGEKYRAAALDLFVPMGLDVAVMSLTVVERDGFLFVTNNGAFMKRFGTAKAGDEDSLSARLAKALPKDAVPASLSSLGLFHGDTLIAHYRQIFEIAAQIGPQFTLRGYEEGPPAERMEAHMEGWKRWFDLVLDLFRTKEWTVGATTRTGNVVRSTKVVLKEK